MTKDKKNIDEHILNMNCIPVSDTDKFNGNKFEPTDVPLEGTYKAHKGPKMKILQQMYIIKLNVNYLILKYLFQHMIL